MRQIYIIPLLTLFLAGAIPIRAQSTAELELTDPWVRALPPTQPNTAAYVSVANPGAAAVEIVGASSPIAGRVEVHTTKEVDGMVSMQRVESIPLSPGGSVQLAPGGMHLMLLDLERMPAEGERVELCLELAGGDEVCTVAPVLKGAGGAHAHHGHH